MIVRTVRSGRMEGQFCASVAPTRPSPFGPWQTAQFSAYSCWPLVSCCSSGPWAAALPQRMLLRMSTASRAGPSRDPSRRIPLAEVVGCSLLTRHQVGDQVGTVMLGKSFPISLRHQASAEAFHDVHVRQDNRLEQLLFRRGCAASIVGAFDALGSPGTDTRFAAGSQPGRAGGGGNVAGRAALRRGQGLTIRCIAFRQLFGDVLTGYRAFHGGRCLDELCGLFPVHNEGSDTADLVIPQGAAEALRKGRHGRSARTRVLLGA